MRRLSWVLGGLCLMAAGCDRGAAPHHRSYADIVFEEDARGARGLDAIRRSLEDPEPRVRAWAVRALGRLEDPGLADEITAVTTDTDPVVRAAAWTALGQAHFGSPGSRAIGSVTQAMLQESDAMVLGALATTVGRLAPDGPEEAEALGAALGQLAGSLPPVDEDPTLVGHLGLARGLEIFARQVRPTGSAADAVATAATPLTALTVADQGITPAKIRTLATAALIHAGRITSPQLAAAASDPEPEVRRVAMVGVIQTGTDFRTLVPQALADPEPRVRLAALATFDRWLRPAQGCEAIVDLLADEDPHVRMAAVDVLAKPCDDVAAQRTLLDGLLREGAGEVGEAARGPGAWHVPARALSALAGLAPEAARERLADFRAHPSPFARAWAARAATQAADLETLELLADDSVAIVRTAAVTGLGLVGGERYADVYRTQLIQEDPHLVLTAVGLLRPDDPQAVGAALDALDRFTVLGRETSRDVRMALLDFAGASPHASPDRIRPYLEDFDPVLAERAAHHLTESTGTAVSASPRPVEPTGTPPADELAAMERAQVILDMARGSQIVIALRPDLAATNAHRFARLALEGYFDGLTFHRVVPNFVIQGGSPGANEYTGDGPYSRDEISAMGHWRGTVGLSTRGRDTGDAQIFINLVDNNRLDFNYTIYGEVVEGMEVVDGVVEGDVITRARLVGRLR